MNYVVGCLGLAGTSYGICIPYDPDVAQDDRDRKSFRRWLEKNNGTFLYDGPDVERARSHLRIRLPIDELLDLVVNPKV